MIWHVCGVYHNQLLLMNEHSKSIMQRSTDLVRNLPRALCFKFTVYKSHTSLNYTSLELIRINGLLWFVVVYTKLQTTPLIKMYFIAVIIMFEIQMYWRPQFDLFLRNACEIAYNGIMTYSTSTQPIYLQNVL